MVAADDQQADRTVLRNAVSFVAGLIASHLLLAWLESRSARSNPTGQLG